MKLERPVLKFLANCKNVITGSDVDFDVFNEALKKWALKDDVDSDTFFKTNFYVINEADV